ncbi:T9SS type A sorting domain-containing protein [Bacteroidota bacterium]
MKSNFTHAKGKNGQLFSHETTNQKYRKGYLALNSSLLILLLVTLNLISYSQSWQQKGADIDGKFEHDLSGNSVCLSSDGNTIAIGAYASGAGYVRVYSWQGSAWIQKGTDLYGEATGDRFGFSVNLCSDGNTLAVGAPWNGENGPKSGHVRVFQWSGSDWIQKGTNIDAEAEGDDFGWTVCLDSGGNTVAIGAIQNSEKEPYAGHVRVYIWNNSEWIQKGADIDGEKGGDGSGRAISLSSDGNTVAIGAPDNNSKATYAGHVRIYMWADTIWTQKGEDIDGKNEKDNSGMSVDLSDDGNIVAIGSPRNAGNGINAGHVRVFKWNNNSWVQVGVDIKGEAASDYSGESVSLSSDGNSVAIGAPYNAGTAPRAGQVRVYDWNGTVWNQRGGDIDGLVNDDQFGGAVSISSDGTIVAAGAIGDDGNGLQAGHVRVFVNNAVGVPESKIIHKMTVYPNPTTEEIHITLGNNYKEVILTVKDLAGKIISKQHFSNVSEIHSEIEGAKGIYFAEIKTNEGFAVVSKVIKY